MATNDETLVAIAHRLGVESVNLIILQEENKALVKENLDLKSRIKSLNEQVGRSISNQNDPNASQSDPKSPKRAQVE